MDGYSGGHYSWIGMGVWELGHFVNDITVAIEVTECDRVLFEYIGLY